MGSNLSCGMCQPKGSLMGNMDLLKLVSLSIIFIFKIIYRYNDDYPSFFLSMKNKSKVIHKKSSDWGSI